jgi:hypothetical protein
LQPQPSDPVESALARARRARRQGSHREEVNALRCACMLREFDARLWAMQGAALLRAGRVDDAIAALRHALWLRERQGDVARARVVCHLLDCARAGVSPSTCAAPATLPIVDRCCERWQARLKIGEAKAVDP